ncbi:hypothetical protein RUM43_009825 [Polyplax serrata]|uniref:Uncharacterized protein n=1 Tax=Polyplax serrata TaxID=468196 RepID=A0AAN8Q3Z7_POLSC
MSGRGWSSGGGGHQQQPPPHSYTPSPPPSSFSRARGPSPYGQPSPRPRWSSPSPQGFSSPVPRFPSGIYCPSPVPMYQPSSSSRPYYSPSPVAWTPEYYYPPFERQVASPVFTGVPLEPPAHTEGGMATADIIAAQSQDYIDEKLAEYQATIYQLQGKETLI